MKRILVLLFITASLVALAGYLSYRQIVAAKPAPTTVSIAKYNDLQAKYDTLKSVDDYKLKQVAGQVVEKDKLFQARTAQRDQLCTIYKNFKPAPTAALCQ